MQNFRTRCVVQRSYRTKNNNNNNDIRVERCLRLILLFCVFISFIIDNRNAIYEIHKEEEIKKIIHTKYSCSIS